MSSLVKDAPLSLTKHLHASTHDKVSMLENPTTGSAAFF